MATTIRQGEFQSLEEHAVSRTAEVSPDKNAGETGKRPRIIVQSKELKRVLKSMGYKSEGTREVWAAAMRGLRENRKAETGVRSLRVF